MTLLEKIMEVYPELTKENFMFDIILRNDADGENDYIEQWNYSKPIPEGLKLGK